MFRYYSPSASTSRFLASLLVAGSFVLLFSSASRLATDRAFQLAVTRHQLNVNGQTVDYQATAGYLTINRGQKQSQANIFYTAYNLDSTRQSNRPITFVFNGGPGSASIWLHMGGFSPIKADTGKTGYKENPNTWLGFTDLVFIDPVGTGYSKPVAGVSPQKFYGYHEDVKATAEFIHSYLTSHHRQADAVFLAGESYGAVRAVGLAAYLQDSLHTRLAGLTLISPALNYRLISFKQGNNTPYAYYLPAYALTAQYHNRLAAQLQKLSPQQLTAKVSAFSNSTYSKFLNSGNVATDQIIDTLHYFTGINKALLRKLNGRITDGQFTRTLLASAGQKVGTFDSRATGSDKTIDPSEAAVRGLFTHAFNQYINAELNYQNHLPYLATTAVGDWNYGPEAADGYLNVSATLKQVMIKNPHLKIKVAAGYYDLATPVNTVGYVINNLGLTADLKYNISVNYYNSGHMIYLSNEANTQFRNNSEQFYKQTTYTNNKS